MIKKYHKIFGKYAHFPYSGVTINTKHKYLIILINVSYILGQFPDLSFWSSGSDFHNVTNFYWDSTAWAMYEPGFESWAPTEPSSFPGERCVEFAANYYHMWSDTQCYLQRPFICEYQPCEEPTVCSWVHLSPAQNENLIIFSLTRKIIGLILVMEPMRFHQSLWAIF
jgi:hypothetical protein